VHVDIQEGLGLKFVDSTQFADSVPTSNFQQCNARS
jgi:hypothetical protein